VTSFPAEPGAAGGEYRSPLSAAFTRGAFAAICRRNRDARCVLVSAPSARPVRIDSNSSDTRAAIRGHHSGSRRRRLSGIQYSRARVTGFRGSLASLGPRNDKGFNYCPGGGGTVFLKLGRSAWRAK
jgi:hypothetical protein